MSKRSQTLRALVTERLTAAAEEIFELVERTIAEYEEELCRSREENQRQKQQQEQVLLHEFQIDLPTQDDAEPGRSQEIPETPLIKEEPEEQRVKQEEEQLPQLTETSPKTNIVITKVSSLSDAGEKHKHAEAGPSVQMETEVDGDHQAQRKAPEARAGGKHQCPFCTKSFMTKQKLEMHLSVHTGNRPFSCSICEKTFARKDHLDLHMRTHPGKRAHGCSEAPSGGSSSATGSTVKFNVQYRGKKSHMNLNGRSYSTFLTEGFTEAHDPATPGAGRGQTWSTAEISCLLEVWSDDFINAQLSTTHKNSAIYAVFSKRLRARGYVRSISQCRIKAKKLRAEYIKTRDAIAKGGADESIKDKFPWYDQMDSILDRKPIVDPVVGEDEDHSPASSSSTDPGSCEESSTAPPAENQSTRDSTEGPSTRTEGPSTRTEGPSTRIEGPSAETLRLPGVRARKRKSKTSRTESDFKMYMEELRQRIEESNVSEQRQDNMFKELMQAQLDAEEKRFRESQEMFSQLLGSIASLRPGQPSSGHPWARPLPAPPSGAGVTPHQHQHQHQHQPDSLNPPNQQNSQHHRPEGHMD